MMKRLLALLMALLLMAPAAMGESIPYYIDGGNADRVHLRKGPSAGEESLGLYFTGTDVILIGYEADWAWVMVGDEVGYIMSEYLTADQTAQAGPWYIVDNPNSTWVNLRLAPSTDGMIAMCPDNGTAVRILGETADGWSYVLCQGVKGYIMTNLLSPRYEAAAGSIQRTTILAQMGDWDDYIHQYIAPNGQALYFTAARSDPDISFEDVNFDGWDDIVVMTTSGASNAYYCFFIYDVTAEAYRFVSVPGEENGICNYLLYPELGLVGSHANSGNAGLLHVRNLYRWEGNNLKLIRSAVSDEWSEDFFEGHTYTNIIHGDILHITVRDHTQAFDASVLWELIIPKEDTEYRDVFTEEMEALWQGLK